MNAKQFKWLFLMVLSLIWGSSFILIKKGLIGLNPFQLGSLRMVFAGLFLLAIGFKTLPKIPQQKWKYITLTGFLGTFFPAYLFAVAETKIGSSISAMLNSLTPLNALIAGGFLFGWNFKRAQILGVIVGLIGSLLLVFSGSDNGSGTDYTYAFLVFIATICYGTNVNLIKKYLSDLSPLTISTGNFAALMLPALLILYVSGFFEVVAIPEVQTSIFYIMLLGVFGTGIANLVFFRLIQMSTPVFAASVTYLIPIVAFFWGLLDNEMLSPVQFCGACVILFGVYLSGKK